MAATIAAATSRPAYQPFARRARYLNDKTTQSTLPADVTSTTRPVHASTGSTPFSAHIRDRLIPCLDTTRQQ